MPETAFRDEPRRLRCTACAHRWTAPPPDRGWTGDIETAGDGLARHLEDAERLERNLASLMHRTPPNDIESAARAPGTGPRSGTGSWLSGPLALAACLALVAGAAWEYRAQVVARVPQMAALYELAGIDVNIRGMEFSNIVVERDYENGLPVLAVTGEIVNVSARMLDVPRVRFGLRDGSEQELYHWTMAVASSQLAPDQRARFATRLSAPPGEARDVVVRFHDAGDRRAAIID